MGSQKWTDKRFGERVRAEREDRELSQAEMAKKLSDNGIHPMHPTTVAKIEAGHRSVRITEAAGIADLFDISLDSMLGLKWRPQQDDVTYALRVLRDAARQSTHQIWATAQTFREQLDALDGIPVDIDADDDLRPLLGEAEVAAYEIKRLHGSLEDLARGCDQLLEPKQETTASEAASRDDKRRKRRDDALADAQRPPTFDQLQTRLERIQAKQEVPE